MESWAARVTRSTFAGEVALPAVSKSVLSAVLISAGRASSAAAVEAGSATVSVGGSTTARSAASERLDDIAVGAFRDRSKFLGRSSVATVEKSRLGVNDLAGNSDNGAVRLGQSEPICFTYSAHRYHWRGTRVERRESVRRQRP